jgi:hypothetical protein
MHDTALTQVPAETYLPHLQPRSSSLAQQLVNLLQEVLVFSQQSREVQSAGKRARGRPPILPLPQL